MPLHDTAKIYLFKVTIETLGKGAKMFKVNKFFYCLLSTYFTPFSSVSFVDFEQKNVSRGVLSIVYSEKNNKYQK